MTYTITDYDSITKETIERNANADEIADIEALQERIISRKAEAEAKAEAKAALLERLGITEDEAKLLLA